MQDLLTLAQTPGPMQSMAQAALQELMGDRGRLEMVGRAPASGSNGLNFGDPSPGHASYPSELMDALVDKYGTQPMPPSGDREPASIAPDDRAQKTWSAEMDHYGPSLMDRIKGLGGALYDDPGLTSDLMGYMTPVAGNIKGSQDFTQDSEAMGDAMAPLSRSSDHGDALGVLMDYLPSLGGDVLQMLSPIGMGRPKMPRRMAGGGKVYETKLSPHDEALYQLWKKYYAPNDSGQDYDLRGAYKAGLKPSANGHWPDTFKEPSEPTFSDESMYAPLAPEQAGHWWGDTFVHPRSRRMDILPEDWGF